MSFLRERRPDLVERMDDPACDPDKLERTYCQFAVSNRLFARTRLAYTRYIRPVLMELDRPASLLDVGCGGGDLPVQLCRWIRRDGLKATLTAIDPDERAVQFANKQAYEEPVVFRKTDTHELIEAGERYDIVMSNHLLHHLKPGDMARVLSECDRLADRRVVFSDIERSPWAYAGFWLIARPFFRNSYNVEDGLTSIRRSYTRHELRSAVPPGWRVDACFPYRLFLVREKKGRRA